MNADDYWKTLAIPGEFDAMDDCDRAQWRGVIAQAFALGRRAGMTEAAGICRDPEPECCNRPIVSFNGDIDGCCGSPEPRPKTADDCAAAIEKARDA